MLASDYDDYLLDSLSWHGRSLGQTDRATWLVVHKEHLFVVCRHMWERDPQYFSAGWEDVTQSYFRSIKHLSNLKHKQHFFKVFNDSGRLLWYKIMPTHFQWICLHWHMPRRCTNCIMPRCPAVFSDSNELNHCLQYQPIISYTSLAFVVLTKPYCAPLNISLLKRTDSKKMSVLEQTNENNTALSH